MASNISINPIPVPEDGHFKEYDFLSQDTFPSPSIPSEPSLAELNGCSGGGAGVKTKIKDSSSEEIIKKIGVNLARMTPDLLQKIVAHISPEDIVNSVSKIKEKFNALSYKEIAAELKELREIIYGQLEDAKDLLTTSELSFTNIKEIMLKMSQFSFLLVLNAEYLLISQIYVERNKYIAQTPITYHVLDSLNEFKRMLRQSDDGINWTEKEVYQEMDQLRNFNEKFLELFFIKCWDIKLDHFGILLLQVLHSAINCFYRVSISYEDVPPSADAKCYIVGQYEVADFSNSMKASPIFQLKMNRYLFLRLFMLYITTSIRVENVNTVLNMRLDTIEKLTSDCVRVFKSGWFGKTFYFMDNEPKVLSEFCTNLPNGIKKITRIIEKEGDSFSSKPNFQGMRFDFQMWCPVADAPVEFFPNDYLETLYQMVPEFPIEMGEDAPTGWPYEFKMDFKLFVKARSAVNDSEAFVQYCVNIKESILDVKIEKDKLLISG